MAETILRGQQQQQRKLAVVAGCNYKRLKMSNKLHGCQNDALIFQQLLSTRFGYDPKSIVLMIDTDDSINPPTGRNIKMELKTMIQNSKPGDQLVFFFSGHGTTLSPSHKGKKRGPPAIVACDGNFITCFDFRDLVNRLHKGATFTIVADSCCSGGLIDKEPVQVGPPNLLLQDDDGDDYDDGQPAESNNKFVSYETLLAEVSAISGLNDPDIGAHMLRLFGADASLMYHALPAHQRPTPLTADQGILLSSSEPKKISYEDTDDNGKPCGAFTKTVSQAFLMKTKPRPNLTNRQLIVLARKILGKPAPGRAKVQFPCLYCSRKNADALFLNSKAPGRGGSSSQASPEEDDN